MRTTYAPPSSKAIDEPAAPNFRELVGRTIAVFFRERFGESSLSTKFPLVTSTLFALFFIGLHFVRLAAERGTLPPNAVSTGLMWGGLGLAACMLVTDRFWLAVTFALIGGLAPWVLLPIIGRIQPDLLDPKSLYSTTFLFTIFGFAVASNLMACWRMYTGRLYPAPHLWAPGRPSRLLSWLCFWTRRTGSRKWEVYILVEPLIVLTVGLALILLVGNWFGLYFLCASFMMADVAVERYFRAQMAVVEAVSAMQHGEERLEDIDLAMVEPKPSASPPVFVAKRAVPSSEEE